jgi:protein SCO1/2
LFVTVDPARDTVPVLAAYASAFHPRLLALTGSEAEIAAVAKAYRVHRRKVLVDPARPADYLVDHGTFSYLMGPDGRFATLLPSGTVAGRMAEVIRRYVTP